MSERERPVLQRRCKVRPLGGGAEEELVVSLFHPQSVEGSQFVAHATLVCTHFSDDLNATRGLEGDALAAVLDKVMSRLQARTNEGYFIYFEDPGDLNETNFWRRGVNRENLLRDVILSRTYSVKSPTGDDSAPLAVELLRPVENIQGASSIGVRVSCPILSIQVPDGQGEDDFQALRIAIQLLAAKFQRLTAQGYRIHLYEPGDVDPERLWETL